MADFVVQHCGPELVVVDLVLWTLFFDGSSCGVGSGIGIVSTYVKSHDLSIIEEELFRRVSFLIIQWTESMIGDQATVTIYTFIM